MGYVLNSITDTPIAGALVLLAGTIHGSLSGPDGHFEFSAVDPGEFVLIVSADGYMESQELVYLQEDLLVNVHLVPKAYELPEDHPFLSRANGVSMELFREVLPLRINAFNIQYSQYGSGLSGNAIFFDQMRVVDFARPLLAFAEIERTEVISGPYRLDLGMDAAIEYHASKEPGTNAYLTYDSGLAAFSSSINLHRNWPGVRGSLSGSYVNSRNYPDGGGILQSAKIHGGRMGGRIEVPVASDHLLIGTVGWLQDWTRSTGEYQDYSALIQYIYSGKSTILRTITATAAIQSNGNESDQVQQGASIVAHLMPLSTFRLKVGADYYRVPYRGPLINDFLPRGDSRTEVDGGVYVTARQRITKIIVEGQYRLDPLNQQWAGSASATWLMGEEWRLFTGGGRVRSERSPRRLRQANLGIRWDGLLHTVELMTFTRKRNDAHLFGATTLIQGMNWSATAYSAVSNFSSSTLEPHWSIWAHLNVVVRGPLNLFTLNPEIYAILAGDPAWISADLWMESKEIGGVTLRLGTRNLLNGAQRYPHSEISEPGRSFWIAIDYSAD